MLASPPAEECFEVAFPDAEASRSYSDVWESAASAPLPDCGFCNADALGCFLRLEKPVVLGFFGLELIIHLLSDRSVKNFIVSDFYLPDVAALLGKDSRSVRRWCIKGLVPNAIQTPGGHWRICGPSLEVAAAKVKFAVLKHTRGQRLKKTTITGKPIPPSALERVEQMKRNLKKSMSREVLLLRVMDGMPEEFMPDGVMESPFLVDATKTAIAWAMISEGPRVEDIAPKFGISRRKFYRWFGKRLPEARVAALRMLGIVESTKAGFDAKGESVGISLPHHASDLERRVWGSGQVKNTTHHDPEEWFGAPKRRL